MTYADLLLRWVSSFTELRVARVRSAAERLHEPPAPIDPADPRMLVYRRRARWLAQNLLRLGHVEEASLERWRTVPPTLVWCSGGRGFLCGARSDDVRERLVRAPGVTMTLLPQHNAPEVWLVSGDRGTVAEAAVAASVHFAPERGGDLLAALSPLKDELARASSEGLPDAVERWNLEARRPVDRWKSVSGGSAGLAGLYRTRQLPRHYYFRRSPGAPVVRLDTPERRLAAAWRIASTRLSLGYCRSRLIFFVPSIGFGLPLLMDRGLILASGRLPTWADGAWAYFDIDPRRATDTARILGLKIKVSL